MPSLGQLKVERGLLGGGKFISEEESAGSVSIVGVTLVVLIYPQKNPTGLPATPNYKLNLGSCIFHIFVPPYPFSSLPIEKKN